MASFQTDAPVSLLASTLHGTRRKPPHVEMHDHEAVVSLSGLVIQNCLGEIAYGGLPRPSRASNRTDSTAVRQMFRIDRASSFCKRPSVETILSAILQRTICTKH